MESNDDLPRTNPLWPSGVSVDMVNKCIDAILADPDISIKGVPDSIEGIVNVSTVRLTQYCVRVCFMGSTGQRCWGISLCCNKTIVRQKNHDLSSTLVREGSM